MNNIQLPSDVKKHVKNKIITRLLKLTVLELIIILIIFFLGERTFGKLDVAIRIAIYIILIVLPFVITKVPFAFIDKSWRGKIKKVDIITDTGTYTVGGGVIYPYTRNTVVLAIEQDDGKIMTKTVKSAGVKEKMGLDQYQTGKVEDIIKEYSEGAMIYHFYGLDELLIINDRKQDHISCVVCGAKNPADNEHCFNCGHSLIKL